MFSENNFKELSFLVYGLGSTGKSVVNFFKKHKLKNYHVWDDINKNLYKSKRPQKLIEALKKVNFIVLSPGVSLNKTKNKKKLNKFKNKIITDIDLFFLLKRPHKSIVVTGTNGKSTTCKILNHLLNKNKFKSLLGGNIGTPILNLKIKKNNYIVIEASSFQLSHSKFIKPDYALLLNITNDHLDWHGNMKNYINSKFKIFENQKKNQYSLIDFKNKSEFKKRNFLGKLVVPKINSYLKLKSKIKNFYIKLDINDENMSYVLTLAKLLNISDSAFIKSLGSFKGLPHRYEIFLKKNNCTFINDSKATTYQSTKFALRNSKNIFWIVGGLPKKNDKIDLKYLKKKIIKAYLIGRHTNFFKKQIRKHLSFNISGSLKNSIIQILKDIKIFKKKNNTILFSPASASFDQFLNFEKRGEKFKKLSQYYARKLI
tara:strand:+ start:868 stop:2154 length:1287 start_codon:yes stop_codon:yes gene_type:complete